MRNFESVFAAMALALCLHASPRDPKTTYDLLTKGSSLSATDAAALEDRIKAKPNDEESRIQLLSYYATPGTSADLAMVKAARTRHILWLIEKDPKDGLGLFQVSTGVYRLNCQGDNLADPEAAKAAGELWLKQVKANPGEAGMRRAAIEALQFCSPEQAEQILIESRDESGLGRVYAAAVLGVTGGSYSNHDPTGSDAGLRQSSFAQKARRALDDATDKDLLVAAAGTLLRDGAILWADGKLDWDYTPLGNILLSRAKAAAPDAMTLYTLPTALPAHGERPPPTIRIGGNLQAKQLVHQVAPAYPPEARRIEGVVQLTVVIGLDGKILYLHADGGPPQLIPASLEAVRQWEYKPTMLNGKPCYVVTRIDVNFTLSR
jgi:hypothetical protein